MGLKFREPGLAASGKPAKVKGSEKKSGVKAAGITKSVTKRKPTDGLASAVKAVTGAAKPAKKGAAPASKPAPAAATAAPGKGKPAARDEAPLKRKQAQAEEAFGTSSSSDDNESDFEAGSDAEMEDTHASGRSEPASERPTSGASAGALSSFRLSPQTVDALAGRGITSLFAIQAATFDIIFDGADLIGRAHTGMGKTLAFALPTIERILILKRSDRSLPRPMKPLALILAPTRELAQQVGREIAAVAPALACACVYGGAPIGQQCSDLRRGIDILIGTPGRVKDLANRGALELDDVRLATLDEADQMLDMGFAEDMADILGRCTHADRQTCLFSATLPPWVVQEAPKYMRPDPRVVDLVGADSKKASSDVRHLAIPCPGPMSMRSSTINDVIAMYTSSSGRVIVFCGTKAECDDLTNSEALRYEAKCLHGDIPQAVREKTMAAFRAGKFRVLIATDVAARGLDMIVDLVLCAKPPMRMRSMRPDEETYVHRSGRTGRAGRKGTCVTLYGPRDKAAIEQIERFTKNRFEWLQPPNPKTLVLTAGDTASLDAAAIPDAAAGLFHTAAEKLLQAKGGDAVAAVAAALALATDTTQVPTARSLLTSQDGYVTMQAAMRSDVNNPSFVWGALRKVLPQGATDGTDNVRGLRLTADGHGAVFDIKESLFLESISPVLDSHEWLTVVDDLPELSTPPDSGGKGFGQGGGKGGGKGGDSWGGGNRRDSWGKGGGGWGGRGGGRGGGGWGGGSPGGGRGGGFGGGRGGRDGYGGGRGRW